MLQKLPHIITNANYHMGSDHQNGKVIGLYLRILTVKWSKLSSMAIVNWWWLLPTDGNIYN